MVKLADIEQEIQTSLTALDDFEGDEEQRQAIEAALVPYLDGLAADEAQKVDALAYVSRKLDAEIEFLGNELERLNNRKKSLMNNKARMRGYLLEVMQANKLQNIRGHESTLFLRSSKSVVLDVPDQDLPEDYREMRVEYKADKKAIKSAIESGQDVPGARIVESQSVQFR